MPNLSTSVAIELDVSDDITGAEVFSKALAFNADLTQLIAHQFVTLIYPDTYTVPNTPEGVNASVLYFKNTTGARNMLLTVNVTGSGFSPSTATFFLNPGDFIFWVIANPADSPNHGAFQVGVTVPNASDGVAKHTFEYALLG